MSSDKYKKETIISYDELMKLSDDACVKLNRTDFYYFMSVENFSKNEDIIKIFSKYIELDHMEEFVRNYSSICGRYLMSAYELKKIITVLNVVPKSSYLIKSDMVVSQLNEYHKKLIKKFNEKKNISNNSLSSNLYTNKTKIKIK